MKVLFASVEVAPLAWAGGMGEVAGSLPSALRRLGVDVRVVMPKHRAAAAAAPYLQRVVDYCPVHMPWWVTGCAVDETTLPYSEVPVYLVEHHHYYDREGIYGPPGESYGDNLERFAFFCRAVIESLSGLGWHPDIVHLNDWHTALIALYQRSWDLPFHTVYTAHHLGPAYHGVFPADQQTLAGIDLGHPQARLFVRDGTIDLARAGLALSHVANTVSPRYAWEVTQEGSEDGVWDIVAQRGEDFCGILNGIDYETWNPETDVALVANYSATDLSGKARCKAELQRVAGLQPDPSIPLLAMVSRIDAGKGLDLVVAALPHLSGVQFVFLGSGDAHYASMLAFAASSRSDVAAFLSFDPTLARMVYAGADLFLMPSRREPAGLAQMIALRYGTIPVVHHTGGLADTITEAPPEPNGFVFHQYTEVDLLDALGRALAAYRDPEGWRRLVQRGMACDFSWDRSATRYVELYQRALKKPRS